MRLKASPMPRHLLVVSTLAASTLCLAIAGASARSVARSKQPHFEEIGQFGMVGGGAELPFALQDPPLGETQAPAATPPSASLAGSTIAALKDGALVVDGDSGKLLRTNVQGELVAELEIGRDAGQLVVDAKHRRAFVSDRAHDRVVVVSLAKGGLAQTDAWRTGAEPFGLALSPDGASLLVTHVADQKLVAFDTTTGFESWSLELGPEPRGVAIAPDGHEALVTFLTTGAVARVDLGGKGHAPKLSFVSLDPAKANTAGFDNAFGQAAIPAQTGNAGGTVKTPAFNPDKGKSFVRNAFAPMYVGHGLAVVPHQLSTPHLASGDFEVPSGGYGGGNGFQSPITHRLAFLDTPDAGQSGDIRTAMATTNLHQPRAMAYDGNSDTLYVAAYGSDDVMAVANVSQASVHLGWQHHIASSEGCAPDGLAVDGENGEVLVFCSLTRQVVRLKGDASGGTAPSMVSTSKELAKSSFSSSELRGKKLFREGRNGMISTFGAMACASCHAEARSDGLTWFLQGNILQTPFLSGRLEGTHPFKWDGQDANLQVSLTSTVKRLGGSGITNRDAKDLQAFLTALPKPRTPTVEEPAAVARGKQLFESSTTGCLNCHDGAMTTDGKRHDLATDLPAVDTPSLIGLAASAPYYHDGSASSLESLLRNNGSIHAMGKTSRLDDAQISDLVAYLETL